MKPEPSVKTLAAALVLTALPWASPATLARAQEPAAVTLPAFKAVFEHYEAVRTTLFLDGTEGVASQAEALAAETEGLERDLSSGVVGAAGDPAGNAAVRELLPEIRHRARELAAAATLEEARAALAELTKPLVRWRKLLAGDDLPVVVYCPMSQKAWLQPEGEELANPYHGESMARCGDVVLQ